MAGISSIIGASLNSQQQPGGQIRGFGQGHLARTIESAGVDRQAFSKLRDSSIASVGNEDKALGRRFQAGLSSKIAQDFRDPATSFGGALDDSVRKAKVRSGIENRGEAAIKNQQLKDRLTIVQAGQRRKGVLQNTLSNAANIQEGVNVGVSNANASIDASNANLFGGIAGGAAATFATKESRENAMKGLKKLGGLFGIGS